ncbi:MAG: response regulator [Bacteroidales bacterium]
MSNLKYRILWVDDNIETFIDLSIDKEFEEYLLGLGFVPEIIKFETADKVLEHLKTDKKSDLILSDLNLANDERGDTLINKIREGDIFTEVLFYSGKPGFEEIAKTLYQDRVSFFSLIDDEGFRKFREKVYLLIRLTISKLQELNNMRGLVMAETSELDNLVVDILQAFFSKETGESTKLREYIIKSIQESAKGNLKKAEKLNKLTNQSILGERIFDADKKARTIGQLLELKGLHTKESFANFYKNYKENVLDKRNLLAHVKSDIIDGIDYLIFSDGSGQKIDQEQCIKIRTNLKKYSELLRRIRNEIIGEDL